MSAYIVGVIVPLAVTLFFRNSKRSAKKRGVPVDVGAEPGYAIRNARFPTQLETAWEGVFTLAALFEFACKSHGDKFLLGTRRLIARENEVTPDGRTFEKVHLGEYEWLTYDKVFEKVCNFASGLAHIGHGREERVAIFADTRAEWFISLQGCFRRNVTVVTIYASLGEDALCHSLNETEVTTVICGNKELKKLVDISGQLHTVKRLICMDDEIPSSASDEQSGRWTITSLSNVEKLGQENPVEPDLPQSTDIAVIMYTSGSTGLPKGVMMTHANVLAVVSSVRTIVPGLESKDVYLAYLPLAHILELAAENIVAGVGSAIGYGSPLTLTDTSNKIKKGTKGDASVLRPTVMAAVPAILDRVRDGVRKKVDATGGLSKKLFDLAYARRLSALNGCWFGAWGLEMLFWNFLVFRKVRAVLGGRIRFLLSAKSGVKEVGWGSFYADSVPNGNHEFGAYSDFFNDLGNTAGDFPEQAGEAANLEKKDGDRLHNSVSSYGEYQESTQGYGGSIEESVNEQDLNSSQYWENMYPGWKFDANTGQWYQVDNFDVTASVQGSSNVNTGNEWAAVSDGKIQMNYLQQTSHSVLGTVAEASSSESVSTWNQVSQGINNGYPEHMFFDPQYPGWYYDTIVQEWRSLESYTSSVQSATVQNHDHQATVQNHHQQKQNEFACADLGSQNTNSIYAGYEQVDKHDSQGHNSQDKHRSWGESYGDYNQQGLNMWQPDAVAKTDTVSDFGRNQQLLNSYDSNVSMNNHVEQHKPFNSLGSVLSYDNLSQGRVDSNGFIGSQNFMPSESFGQQFNQGTVEQSKPMNISNDHYSSQKPINFSQKSFHNHQQLSYAPNAGMSSAGRPPHALVTFGFGGKLIVMKDSSSSSLTNASFASQEPVGGSIYVLNLMEVILGNDNNALNIRGSTCNYFHALCQQSFPGPLLGGNVGSKELNKWIDDRIANCESPDMDYRNGKVLKLLLSLLKIACQHYGKFRSPFGTDVSLKESEAPESAVAKLFASAKRNGTEFSDYGALSRCLQSLPSEGQIQATASEVQNLLVSGRKKEALQCAQIGQLWGPALVLASQLGDQFYVDTVKQMALRQLVAGSPLRTLCLLIAGQPADVFSSDATTGSGLPGAISQQPIQFEANGMLDDWEENLAVITANRTKDDELVIIHLGDCLLKERSEITGAHICYLVAEANFESYSDSARLCLIAADHWKHPRTYASPEAIQRTELYEYSKVLGNSQFILLPFQPYKLIYAYMLAEVGKISDSLKYCQAILKSLKVGRAPEVETWKQLILSLEERIRTHQQGGYTANLAPAKLVGKLLNFFDSTAHRVVGGLPPPVPSTSPGSMQGTDRHHQPTVPRVSASQSTMAMSSLMPSASMEPISEWAADGNRMTMHNRSASEPDIGRTPRQVESPKGTSSNAQGKTSGSGTGSRFGRFGFGSQLLQRTVGLVLRPRSDRQAKLGETNKFYYDEKLKRWVEEGAEPPAEEAALPPPPTTSAFQNGVSDYNLKSALKSDGSPTNGSPTSKTPNPVEHASGIPPIPTSSNQFSARGRMGVRARYVDTFNQGGRSSAKLFQSPSVPSVKPAVSANAKFFVPTPLPSSGNSTENVAENVQESAGFAEYPSTSIDDSLQSSSLSSKMNMQRAPSMDNIPRRERTINDNIPMSSHARRTASWSGSFSDSFSPPKMVENKPLGEAAGMPPSSFIPGDPSITHMPMNGGGIGDDLHEVAL